MAVVKTIDVLGLGAVAVDDLIYVEAYPPPDAKARVVRLERHCGGLTATARELRIADVIADQDGVRRVEDDRVRDAVENAKHEKETAALVKYLTSMSKTLTEEERQRRSEAMTEINKRRTIRVQGIVVNGPRGNTTVQQPVKPALVQPVTNPALVDQSNRASQNPPPFTRVARVQGRRAE